MERPACAREHQRVGRDHVRRIDLHSPEYAWARNKILENQRTGKGVLRLHKDFCVLLILCQSSLGRSRCFGASPLALQTRAQPLIRYSSISRVPGEVWNVPKLFDLLACRLNPAIDGRIAFFRRRLYERGWSRRGARFAGSSGHSESIDASNRVRMCKSASPQLLDRYVAAYSDPNPMNVDGLKLIAAFVER